MNRPPSFLSDPLLRPLYESFSNTTTFAWHDFTVEAPRFEFDPPVSVAPVAAVPTEANYPSDLPPHLRPYMDLLVEKPDVLPYAIIDDARESHTPAFDVLNILITTETPAPLIPADDPLKAKPAAGSGQTAPQEAAVVLLHDGLTLIL